MNIDRQSPMLMPPDLRDWLPENHIARFIVTLVEGFSLRSFRVNHRGTGDRQYPPSMLASLLIYCYATGRFSSRVIEEATHSDVAVRFITGDTHPDHDTICSFRRNNVRAFRDLFVKVLAVAGQSGLIKKVGGVSVDGTKIKADASKHSAVSYERAGKLIEQLRLEVEQLTGRAEEADNTPLDDGLTVPDEIARREDRIEKLREARSIIEQHYEAERKEAQAEHEAKLADRQAKRRAGKPPRGPDPKPPPDTPPGNRQHNFTDPESRIMKAGSGQHFEQSYNAQAAVDTEGSMMILGCRVTCNPNDQQELQPTVDSVDGDVREISHVLADTGYMSERQRYRLRKQTVEPVFGIIKHVMGFRQFHLRGHPKADLEWCVVCLSYNVRRLFRMSSGALPTNAAIASLGG